MKKIIMLGLLFATSAIAQLIPFTSLNPGFFNFTNKVDIKAGTNIAVLNYGFPKVGGVVLPNLQPILKPAITSRSTYAVDLVMTDTGTNAFFYTYSGGLVGRTNLTLIDGGQFVGDGSQLTGLNASQLTSGIVPLARLSNITSNQMDAGTVFQYTNSPNATTAAQAVVATNKPATAFIADFARVATNAPDGNTIASLNQSTNAASSAILANTFVLNKNALFSFGSNIYQMQSVPLQSQMPPVLLLIGDSLAVNKNQYYADALANTVGFVGYGFGALGASASSGGWNTNGDFTVSPNGIWTFLNNSSVTNTGNANSQLWADTYEVFYKTNGAGSGTIALSISSNGSAYSTLLSGVVVNNSGWLKASVTFPFAQVKGRTTATGTAMILGARLYSHISKGWIVDNLAAGGYGWDNFTNNIANYSNQMSVIQPTFTVIEETSSSNVWALAGGVINKMHDGWSNSFAIITPNAQDPAQEAGNVNQIPVMLNLVQTNAWPILLFDQHAYLGSWNSITNNQFSISANSPHLQANGMVQGVAGFLHESGLIDFYQSLAGRNNSIIRYGTPSTETLSEGYFNLTPAGSSIWYIGGDPTGYRGIRMVDGYKGAIKAGMDTDGNSVRWLHNGGAVIFSFSESANTLTFPGALISAQNPSYFPGGIYGNGVGITNLTPATLTQTNFMSGNIYTNATGKLLTVSSIALITSGNVTGFAEMDLIVTNNASGYYVVLPARITTTLAGILVPPYTTFLSVDVPATSTYWFTNLSTGAGNSSSLVSGSGTLKTPP